MRIHSHGTDGFTCDQEFTDLIAVLPPDFCGVMTRFLATVEIFDFQNDRHHKAAYIFKIDDIKMTLQFQQIPVNGFEFIDRFLIFFSIFIDDIQRIIIVVEINQLGKLVHKQLQVFVA